MRHNDVVGLWVLINYHFGIDFATANVHCAHTHIKFEDIKVNKHSI